jgi:hypothetical protein
MRIILPVSGVVSSCWLGCQKGDQTAAQSTVMMVYTVSSEVGFTSMRLGNIKIRVYVQIIQE